MEHPPPAVAGSRRSLAPDLARGVMLLMIALANVSWYLHGQQPGVIGPHPEPRGTVEAVLQVLMMTFVDGQVFPMFAFLFAYGMVQFYTSRRRQGRSDKDVRGMMARRHWTMLVLGALHAALLFVGDILGTYAAAGLFVGWLFFRRRESTLRVWLLVLGALGLVVALGTLGLGAALRSGVGKPVDNAVREDSAGNPDYVASMLARVQTWLVTVPVAAVLYAIPVMMMLGWLAARRGLLDEPGRHLALLRRIAGVTLPLGWSAGLVTGLQQVHVITFLPEWTLTGWHMCVSILAGAGYAAVFGLVAARCQARPPLVVRAVSEVGQRSLSCYLWQSIVMAPVLSAWGLGLGHRMSTWSSLVFALAVWMGSLVLACVLAKAGMRGPFEVLLRRVTYGRAVPAAPRPMRVVMPWDLPPGVPADAVWMPVPPGGYGPGGYGPGGYGPGGYGPGGYGPNPPQWPPGESPQSW